MPLHIGKAIAYGALLKSGRITDPQDILQVTNSLIGCSRVKFYMHTLAFKFLEELSLQVASELLINESALLIFISIRLTKKTSKKLYGQQ